MRIVTPVLITLVQLAVAVAQTSPVHGAAPLTRAERSVFAETSTHADVLAFLDGLRELPRAGRLHLEWIGRSGEEKDIPMLVARGEGVDPEDALRILVNANIHAGEVEGKEVAQMLLREIARGEHAELLERAVIYFVPDFNPDGNDRIDRAHRVSQNGPDGGVGTRVNAAGLDLNRDFIKLESSECRALVDVFVRHDPHYLLDLHTTNGSPHGYHLTYSPSLSTNVDSRLDAFIRGVLLAEVRASMADSGWRVFDYGNFPRERPRSWTTYDHRPRFGTNYYGLRNRLSVVVEAYSYLDFEARIRVTRAFVLANLRAAVAHAAEIRALCAAADARAVAGPWAFGHDSTLAEPVEQDVLVGRLEAVEIGDLGTRYVATPHVHAERMPVRVSFTSRAHTPRPAAWMMVDPPEAVMRNVWKHGIEVERLAADTTASCEVFLVDAVRRAQRPFQGHHEVAVSGRWVVRSVALPAGAVVVRADQRLGRLAAQLLEPQSEDSLATWNYFDTALGDGPGPRRFPVMRLPGE